LKLRIPGWAAGQPVPSDLYSYEDKETADISIKVNGERIDSSTEDGYAILNRSWKSGDRVEIDFPMPIRRVHAHPNVEADQGRVALERGPIVYCAEGVDNQGHVENLVLGDDVNLLAERQPDLLNGVTVMSGSVEAWVNDNSSPDGMDEIPFMAIPYYAWNHRGPCEMAVWLPENKNVAVIPE
ncbi:MAG: glycoside hydrolase family 127 protein, partial [Candidatus Omnitrophica bacterium]|nr:glycoside hydrolase family 127 protein [Candidatus Omnitrophota bacterium]